jgi:hypothetical protein
LLLLLKNTYRPPLAGPIASSVNANAAPHCPHDAYELGNSNVVPKSDCFAGDVDAAAASDEAAAPSTTTTGGEAGVTAAAAAPSTGEIPSGAIGGVVASAALSLLIAVLVGADAPGCDGLNDVTIDADKHSMAKSRQVKFVIIRVVVVIIDRVL